MKPFHRMAAKSMLTRSIKMTAVAHAVLDQLVLFADERTLSCNPSQQLISKRAGCSVRAVRDAIRMLERERVIECSARNGRTSSTYWLFPDLNQEELHQWIHDPRGSVGLPPIEDRRSSAGRADPDRQHSAGQSDADRQDSAGRDEQIDAPDRQASAGLEPSTGKTSSPDRQQSADEPTRTNNSPPSHTSTQLETDGSEVGGGEGDFPEWFLSLTRAAGVGASLTDEANRFVDEGGTEADLEALIAEADGPGLLVHWLRQGRAVWITKMPYRPEPRLIGGVRIEAQLTEHGFEHSQRSEWSDAFAKAGGTPADVDALVAELGRQQWPIADLASWIRTERTWRQVLEDSRNREGKQLRPRPHKWQTGQATEAQREAETA